MREITSLRAQARACGAMGSPLYASILERCIAGEDGGVVVRFLAERPASEDLIADAVVLRLLAAVHRLALEGRTPSLAAHYSSCGGDGDPDAAWPPFVAALTEHEAWIRREIDAPLQTNEIGRAAALLGGFLLVSQRFSLPLRILEVGTSAGLTLRWDRFRYEASDWAWGPPDSLVRFTDHLTEAPPFAPDTQVRIAERAGCDVAPIDPRSVDGYRRLISFVWPDQTERIARLRAACEVARSIPANIERAEGARWLAERLAKPLEGLATVVFHTVVAQYMDDEEREKMVRGLYEAGSAATARAPLAYLTLEPQPRSRANVLLRLWPEGEELALAHATLHGRNVVWLYHPTTL